MQPPQPASYGLDLDGTYSSTQRSSLKATYLDGTPPLDHSTTSSSDPTQMVSNTNESDAQTFTKQQIDHSNTASENAQSFRSAPSWRQEKRSDVAPPSTTHITASQNRTTASTNSPDTLASPKSVSLPSSQSLPCSRSASMTPVLSNMSPPPSRSSSSGTIRLNWAEMICCTISESPGGRLVIQDLFEGMCHKFPDIREWAAGKDWEARVKNRIKSTLSIKSNLFVKVPRPSNASGKGSWWTLSAEAQGAYRQGRVGEAVRGLHANGGTGGIPGHGRPFSPHRTGHGSFCNMSRDRPTSIGSPSFSANGYTSSSFDFGKDSTSPSLAEAMPPFSPFSAHTMTPIDLNTSPVMSNATPSYSLPTNIGMGERSMSQPTIGSPGTPSSTYCQSPALSAARSPPCPVSYSQGPSAMNLHQGIPFPRKMTQNANTPSHLSQSFYGSGPDMQFSMSMLNDPGTFGPEFAQKADTSFAGLPGEQSHQNQQLPLLDSYGEFDFQERLNQSAFSAPASMVGTSNPGMSNHMPAFSLQALANLDNNAFTAHLAAFNNTSMSPPSGVFSSGQQPDLSLMQQNMLNCSNGDSQSLFAQYSDPANLSLTARTSLNSIFENESECMTSQAPLSLGGGIASSGFQPLSLGSMGLSNMEHSANFPQAYSNTIHGTQSNACFNTTIPKFGEVAQTETKRSNYSGENNGGPNGEPAKVVTAS